MLSRLLIAYYQTSWFLNFSVVQLPNLCVEVEELIESTPKLTGNRIVDVSFFIEQIRKLALHDQTCTMGKMNFSGENKKGLVASFIYNCKVCNRKMEIKTQNCDNDLNQSFVWGVSSIGSGYKQSEELLSVINVPAMTKNVC
ncbi:hypothetical protein RN001_003281 [Aquatica leii]|uniref:Mutator-like transposase domain-containing protein n=1 Tax=Aquatica leii TaxID=1421715 RepID=A0AAN7ST00_9COLE|nr:hypothetical protein RN001_003281 [Aquatica leii]